MFSRINLIIHLCCKDWNCKKLYSKMLILLSFLVKGDRLPNYKKGRMYANPLFWKFNFYVFSLISKDTSLAFRHVKMLVPVVCWVLYESMETKIFNHVIYVIAIFLVQKLHAFLNRSYRVGYTHLRNIKYFWKFQHIRSTLKCLLLNT